MPTKVLFDVVIQQKMAFQSLRFLTRRLKLSKYVTAETVSPGHPDKIADLISDYVLTKALQNNSSSRVAVETFLTGTKNGGLVLVGGEISEIAEITTDDVHTIVKEALNKTIKTSFDDFDLDKLLEILLGLII